MGFPGARARHLLYAVLIANALLFVAVRAVWCSAPFALDPTEGAVLWQSSAIAHPSQAFRDIQQPPYVTFLYPPLFPWLVHLAGLVTGEALLAGRWISLLSACALAALAAALSRHRLLAALLVFTLASLQTWTPSLRVDLLGLALSLAGLLCFERRRILPAALLLTAALYTKQTFLAAPLACLLHAAITNRPLAARFAASCLLFALPPFLVLQNVTHGWFWTNLVSYNVNPWTLQNLLHWLGPNLLAMLPLLPAAVLGVRGAGSLRLIWAAAALLISLTAGKLGADVNYFLEWNVAACVLAAMPVQLRPAFLWLAVLAMTPRMAQPLDLLLTNRGQTGNWTRRAAAHAESVRWLAQAPGPVLSANILATLHAGKPHLYYFDILTLLARTGQWDPQPLLHDIARRRFAAILLLASPGEIVPGFLSTLHANYQPSAFTGDYCLFTPRPARLPPRSATTASLPPPAACSPTGSTRKMRRSAGSGSATLPRPSPPPAPPPPAAAPPAGTPSGTRAAPH